jgi:hypothetical protein
VGWTPEALRALAARVVRGGEALRGLGRERLLAVWSETVAAFRDSRSAERRALESPLARNCRLSPEGLAAGLEAVLGGVAREPAAKLFAEASGRLSTGAPPPNSPVLTILAANLPALAVQPLLPALALGRPAIVKSPTAEPLFAPAFAAALARREPALGEAVAAVTWRGGDRALEAPLLEAAGRVLAYGERETLDDLDRRAPGKLIGYGPKTSLAVLGAGADPRRAAEALARDVALFDQRGCLSVAAVYTAGDAGELAEALAGALRDLAARWPPGPIDAAAAAAVQQLRAEADLSGLRRPPLPLPAGTVIVDPHPAFHPTPGLRTVRVHPLADLSALPELLVPWRGRLQGAALAGPEAEALRPALAGLGLSRFAAPGNLQSPDAAWHNGGRHPLDALSAIG